MPALGPIKRNNLIHYLRKLGFDGPYSGGNHQFMRKGSLLRIPNPHQGDISASLLKEILGQGAIDLEERERL